MKNPFLPLIYLRKWLLEHWFSIFRKMCDFSFHFSLTTTHNSTLKYCRCTHLSWKITTCFSRCVYHKIHKSVPKGNCQSDEDSFAVKKLSWHFLLFPEDEEENQKGKNSKKRITRNRKKHTWSRERRTR